MNLLDRLLLPRDEPFTKALAEERLRDQTLLENAMERDPDLALVVAELVTRSSWAWLCLVGRSYVENDTDQMPVRPSPPHLYIKLMCDFLDQRNEDGTWKNHIVGAFKSRQLFISWLSAHRLLWQCCTRRYSTCPVISQTQFHANEFVERAVQAYGMVPEIVRKTLGCYASRLHTPDNTVIFPNGSKLMSLVQSGGAGARSLTPTMMVLDEASFQEEFYRNYVAVLGGHDARSQLLLVSTSKPGSDFNLLIEDCMDGKIGKIAQSIQLMPGLKLNTNENNKLVWFDIDYTVDPFKRRPEWKIEAKKGYPDEDAWAREQERSFTSRSGLRCFPMIDDDVHVLSSNPVFRSDGRSWEMHIPGDDPDGYWRHVRIVRAIDHGTVNFTADVEAAIDESGDWFVFRGEKWKGLVAQESARRIWENGRQFGNDYWVDCIDAFQGLHDRRGQAHELYREFLAPDGTFPFQNLQVVHKGHGSREEGIDRLRFLLTSALARSFPDSPYFTANTAFYTPAVVAETAQRNALYLAPATRDLIQEIHDARYDIPKNAQVEASEKTQNVQDDCLDALRYLFRLVQIRFEAERPRARLSGARPL